MPSGSRHEVLDIVLGQKVPDRGGDCFTSAIPKIEAGGRSVGARAFPHRVEAFWQIGVLRELG